MNQSRGSELSPLEDAVRKALWPTGLAPVSQPPLDASMKAYDVCNIRVTLRLGREDGGGAWVLDVDPHVLAERELDMDVNEIRIEWNSVLSQRSLSSLDANSIVDIVRRCCSYANGHHVFLWAKSSAFAPIAMCCGYRIPCTSVLLETSCDLPQFADYKACIENRGGCVMLKGAANSNRWAALMRACLKRHRHRYESKDAQILTDNTFCLELDPETSFVVPELGPPVWPHPFFQRVNLGPNMWSCIAWHGGEKVKGLVVFFHGNGGKCLEYERCHITFFLQESVTNYPFDCSLVTHFQALGFAIALPEYRG
jgi:hypothetical protein